MTWQKSEIDYLRKNFPHLPDISLSKQLNKSPNAIRIKASRLSVKKNSTIYRNNLELNPIEEQLILGGLMGDLHCRKTHTSKNARLEGGHGPNQSQYVDYKVKSLQRLKWTLRLAKDGAVHYASKSFPCLNEYHKLFYPNQKKIISRNILDKIDRLGLFIWYLDDGNYHSRDKSSRLHTNCFNHEENLIIKKWFEEKWNIFTTLHYHKNQKDYPGKIWYYQYIPVSDTIKLHNLFHDFDIPECMKYKFPFTNEIMIPTSVPGALVAHN